MTLPLALQPFAPFRQFITHNEAKQPTDWQTGKIADAQDPAIWTDYDTAYACGFGMVGFVLTPHDPFWCIDIDNCLTAEGWSPLSQEVCALLPGAAVEVSRSGRGLHIFGTGTIPPHACRGGGMELYHTGRYIAFGGREGTTGSAATDCTAGLAEVVRRYFSKTAPTSVEAVGWSHVPVAEWRGSENDEDLIRRACNSKSTSAMFGGKATFAQLWDGDAVSLGRAFPATDGRPYDASSADAALCQHLAFWTGKNCERMKRLMLASKLVRDKYERDDYLPRTILQAIAKQVDVCKDKPPAKFELTPQAISKPQIIEGETIISPEQQIEQFSGCTYINDIQCIMLPGGHVWNKSQFDDMLGNYSYVVDRVGGKVTKSAWEAFNMSKDIRFPKVHSSAFRPDKAPGEVWRDGHKDFINSYWPFKREFKRGNIKPFTDHLARILPIESDRAIVLAYMAAIVQHPGVKFQWAPLIQGAPGNGKSLLSRCVAYAVGNEFSHFVTNAQEVTEKFNQWILNKIFIGIEDIYVAAERREVMETLKPMITSERLEIRGMGKDKVTRDVCANFILNSNHKDAIKKTQDDRRFAVLYCAQQSASDIVRDGMGGDYFPDLYNWLRRGGFDAIAWELQNYPIPDELNPATQCHRAPNTSSTAEAVRESMGSLEQEIEAAVVDGRVGFRGGWISMHWLDQLIKETGSRLPRNKRREMLGMLGYEAHPGVEGGQAHRTVAPDGTRSRLFIRSGHPHSCLSGAAVAKQYEADQQATNPDLYAVQSNLQHVFDPAQGSET